MDRNNARLVIEFAKRHGTKELAEAYWEPYQARHNEISAGEELAFNSALTLGFDPTRGDIKRFVREFDIKNSRKISEGEFEAALVQAGVDKKVADKLRKLLF